MRIWIGLNRTFRLKEMNTGSQKFPPNTLNLKEFDI